MKNNRLGLQRILDVEGQKPGRLRLFFTSPVSTAQASDHLRSDQVSLVCDPWLEINHTPKLEAREMLNLPCDRIILLHAGTSRPEKGLGDLCKAIRGLPEEYARKLLLLRAGKTDRADRKHLSELESAGLAHTLDRFISEEELQLCYAACDWVTLPYRNQSESSGILIHAAANLRPVLASDFGLIGENTRNFELGRVFAHEDIKALSSEIIRLVTDQTLVQESGMMRFSKINSPTEFVSTLRNRWLEDLGNVTT
jgi:glycosyltransferase involved in cell wall biosynthesis